MTSDRQRLRAARLYANTADPLPLSVAAAQQIIISASEYDPAAVPETELWLWLAECTQPELDHLDHWLTHAAHAWTQALASPGADLHAAHTQLDRLIADTTAVQRARSATNAIYGTWRRLTEQQPALRPSDALTAAYAIHA